METSPSDSKDPYRVFFFFFFFFNTVPSGKYQSKEGSLSIAELVLKQTVPHDFQTLLVGPKDPCCRILQS